MTVIASHRLGDLFAEVSADEARDAAQKILNSRKYRPPESAPRPMSWLGRLEQRVFSAIGRFVSRIVPGAGFMQWLVLAVIVAVAAWLISRIMFKRKARGQRATTAATVISVDTLDAEADAAMARGDYREAVILRFRAGIARLERGPRPAASRLTNATIGATIPTSFPSLGAMFDGIRYGDRPAQLENAELSASDWPKVLEEARIKVLAPPDHLAPRKKRTWRRRGR